MVSWIASGAAVVFGTAAYILVKRMKKKKDLAAKYPVEKQIQPSPELEEARKKLDGIKVPN